MADPLVGCRCRWQFLWLPLKQWREVAALEMTNNRGKHFNAQLYLTLVPVSGLVVPLGLLWELHQVLMAHGG